MIEKFEKRGEGAVPEIHFEESVVDKLLLIVAIGAVRILSADERPVPPDGIDTYDRKPGKVRPLKPQLEGHRKKGCFLR